MNDLVAIGLEAAVVAAGVVVLWLELRASAEQKRALGYIAALAVALVFVGSFAVLLPEPRVALGGMYVLDELALFFKRFFLLAALLVLLMSVEFSDRFDLGVSEYYALTLFALAGMMFAASAHNFCLLFISLELVAVSFYVLVGFQRRRAQSLEAAVKYLILGAMSSAFLVYGIALVYGVSGSLDFGRLHEVGRGLAGNRLLSLGLLLVFAGLGFKIAVVPFQVWVPDVYEGAPAPTTAFLAVGSKAAGLALLLRVLHAAAPVGSINWTKLLMVVGALTILYGNLCALPQRNLKRLLGYSSIAHAGYLLLGVALLSPEGTSAVLYYLSGYLFAVLAAFTVVCVALRALDNEDSSALAGLHHRSPVLAAALTGAMVSLAGVPPLAGFFGKFWILESVLAQAAAAPGTWWVLAAAIAGILLSLYYYFAVIRAVYWSPSPVDLGPLPVPKPLYWALCFCLAGLLWLGVFPNSIVVLVEQVVLTSFGS